MNEDMTLEELQEKLANVRDSIKTVEEEELDVNTERNNIQAEIEDLSQRQRKVYRLLGGVLRRKSDLKTEKAKLEEKIAALKPTG